MVMASGFQIARRTPVSLCGASLAVCLLVPGSGFAAPLGLPENTAKIGYGMGAANVAIDDPDGSTRDNWAAQPFNLIYTDWLLRDIRQWTELYYFKAALDADATNVGQNVQSYGIRFSLQKNYRVSPSWSPWFGAGIEVANSHYDTRHTKDADGFLLQSFDDRQETNVAFLINMLSEWSVQKDWTIGAKLEQSIPSGGGIAEFAAAVTVLYRY